MPNSTSKYPRNSVEAFPNTTAYACSLERPESSRRLVLTDFKWLAIGGAICMVLGLLFGM